MCPSCSLHHLSALPSICRVLFRFGHASSIAPRPRTSCLLACSVAPKRKRHLCAYRHILAGFLAIVNEWKGVAGDPALSSRWPGILEGESIRARLDFRRTLAPRRCIGDARKANPAFHQRSLPSDGGRSGLRQRHRPWLYFQRLGSSAKQLLLR